MKRVKSKKPFYKRWWFIAIVVLGIIGAIGGGGDTTDTNTEANKENTEIVQESSSNDVQGKEDVQEIKEEAKEEPIEEPIEETSEVQRSDMNIDEYLAYMINEIMGEETNMSEKTLVSISDGDEGIKDIELRANDNITNNFIIGKMLIDATEYFESISKDPEVMELKAVSLIYEMTLVDTYGNEGDYPVHIITLNIETMNKINWDNFYSDNLPTVADTYFLHPVLKD